MKEEENVKESSFKQCRRDLGLTQAALGKLLGVNQNTVSMYENGLIMPPADMLKRISQVFNKPLEEVYSWFE